MFVKSAGSSELICLYQKGLDLKSHYLYEGRSINKLQNSVILLVFQI